MGKLPYLNELPVTRRTVDVFGGYNHNLRIGDGEFFEMKNMTSDYYPVLSPRSPRGVHAVAEYGMKIGAVAAKEKLCYMLGDTLVVGSEYITPLPYLTTGEKRFVSMGAYLIVLPDGYYVNVSDTSERGYIGEFALSNGVTFTLCDENGVPLDIIAASRLETVMAYTNATNNTDTPVYWCDLTRDDYPIYKCYYETLASGGTNFVRDEAEAETYVRIDSRKIANRRYEGELVNFTKGYNVPSELADMDGIKTISAVGDAVVTAYIVVNGKLYINDSYEITQFDLADEYGNFYISPETQEKIRNTGVYVPSSVPNISMKSATARLPKLDYACERGNRLWACRYGANEFGVTVNEIYASMQGNFERWEKFEGIADDSYAASVGSDGPFTGCTAFGDCTVFFKENCFHKVYGKIPSEFYTVDVDAPGVESGSDRSLAIVDGVLYYKSLSGVYAYDGSMPANVSSALGGEYYRNAVACAFDGKYYISMSDMADTYTLLVYDTRRRMWHKEDDAEFCGCDTLGDEMYFSDGDKIRTVRSTNGSDEEAVKWECESGLIGVDDPMRKYVSKLNVRMSLPSKSKVEFYARYDSSPVPELIGKAQGKGLQTFVLPMRVRRCDHLTLIMRGEGEAKIYSVTKSVEEGSDVV